MPYTQLSNLDYQDIKIALKEYLRAQTDFTDFDFEGSTWSSLIDLLAYNTYYTAFNTNMVVNELFLDSATLRDNVVALAKQLGYKPKSRTAPKAIISFDVSFPGTAPELITLRKGTGFVTTFDNNLYQYVTIDDHKVVVNNGSANFSSIPVYEGSFVTNFYTYNSALKSQRFVIENPSVDTNSIRVKVYPSSQSSFFELYEVAENILTVDPSSKVYFIEEIEDEKYEIFFGDGVIGRSLENGEYIEISYLVTNGPETNGAKTFTFSGVLEDSQGNSNYTVTVNNLQTIEASSGGENIEPVSKIKFNAPRYFGTQNRAVTSQDYAAIVRNVYPSVADIIVFGGEDADPPEYGKVKIVVKPSNATYLTSFTKQEIVEKLKPYMVASVTPDIIDPSILYVELTSKIYYDSSVTNQSQNEIVKDVTSGLEEYIPLSGTEKFNGKFRYSKFVGVIDDSNRSINSNQTSVMMRKDFYPLINSKSYYEICYQNKFDADYDGQTVFSTGFVVSEYPDYTVYVEDRDGIIVLYRLDPLSGLKIVLNDSLGTVNYEKGEVVMYDLTIIKGSFDDNRIELRAKPFYNDINALREVYLDVDMTQSKFTAYKE